MTPTWPRCGHPDTPENTSIAGSGVRCKTCKSALNRKYARPKYDPLVSRISRLPDQLSAARHKVRALENEARRYGMTNLLERQA